MTRVFTSLMLVIGIVVCAIAYGSAQGRQNPFVDRADTGELIHVLPTPAAIRSPRDTQPTDAPPSKGTAVYAASYGSGKLVDHGGEEMSGAGFVAIYWNTDVSDSVQTSAGYGTIQAQINAFVTSFGGKTSDWSNSNTDDYAIVQQYGSHDAIAPGIANLGFYRDNQPLQSKISDSTIRTYLANLFNARTLQPNTQTLYGIYFPPGMKVQLQGGMSCTSFCGYHSHFTYVAPNGVSYQIKYASFPYLNCSGCSLAGKSVADMLTIVTSHEIREAVTDPGSNNKNAWYDSQGYEADDKCAWHNLYQMTNGGFWVQPEYSNGGAVTRSGFTATYPGPGCVVPNR
jgi:hypothetical protein